MILRKKTNKNCRINFSIQSPVFETIKSEYAQLKLSDLIPSNTVHRTKKLYTTF